jgi:hypothetical protein
MACALSLNSELKLADVEHRSTTRDVTGYLDRPGRPADCSARSGLTWLNH